MASLPAFSSSSSGGAADSASEMRHCAEKGRYLVATRDLPAQHTLWQEMPVIVCTSHAISRNNADAAAKQGDSSIEERAFPQLLPLLPIEVAPVDLLLALHWLRRLRLFGEQSPCWTLMQQLQHSDASESASAANPSPFQRRFITYARLAERIFEELQRQSSAATADSSAVAAPVQIDAQLIARCFGILQLNAHRCAPWDGSDEDPITSAASAAVSSAASSAPLPPPPPVSSLPPRSKGLSLRLSMLEHNCVPNAQFASEWVDSYTLTNALQQDAAAAEEDALRSFAVVAGQMLCASSSLRSNGGRTLILTLRTLRAVPSGECLSISYYPCHTRTAMRQAHLRNLHGFICRCIACEGKDPARSFHCCFPSTPASAAVASAQEGSAGSSSAVPLCEGIISPRGLGSKPQDFSCDRCDRTFSSEAQLAEVLRVEQNMRSSGGGGGNQAATDKQPAIVPHASHYLMPGSSSSSSRAR